MGKKVGDIVSKEIGKFTSEEGMTVTVDNAQYHYMVSLTQKIFIIGGLIPFVNLISMPVYLILCVVWSKNGCNEDIVENVVEYARKQESID